MSGKVADLWYLCPNDIQKLLYIGESSPGLLSEAILKIHLPNVVVPGIPKKVNNSYQYGFGTLK